MQSSHFCGPERLNDEFGGRSVAIVGSGPGCLENEHGLVDSFDVVVRVNNYKTGVAQGHRCDVHYSYFGNAIRKTAEELKADGVHLLINKCPDAFAIESDWHRMNNKMEGVDFRWIYEKRRDWWFCDTYVPPLEEFRAAFDLLGGHVPTTGFSAVLRVIESRPRSIFLTGFDFFSSRLHNVNEPWKPGNPNDPIGHVPEKEREWLRFLRKGYAITCDARLEKILSEEK
jgi:hypothetical protein